MKPLVSIIMNSCNSSKYLRLAIDSILRQSYQRWEIIFFDNQSTDGSLEIAQNYGDTRIKIYSTQERVVLGAARNAAIAKVTGDWIAFLDTDDLWHPDKLDRQIEYLLNNTQIDFLYTNYANILSESDIEAARPRLSGMQPIGDVFGRFIECYPVNLQTVLIRAASLLKMEKLFSGSYEVAEEYDLFLRFLYQREAGYLDEILVYYRLHSTQQSREKINCYPVEIVDIIKNLKVLYPASVIKFSNEYNKIDNKILYYRARVYSRNGDKIGARKMLQPIMLKDWRYFVMMFLLCLPGDLFSYAHRRLGRYH